MNPHPPRPEDLDRLEQLLTDRATEGLAPEEWSEFEALLEVCGDEDLESFDRAAAWLESARYEAQPAPEPLPAHLRERIVAEGRVHVRARNVEVPRRGGVATSPTTSPNSSGAPNSVGWLGFAAAALFGIALGMFLGVESPPDTDPTRACARLLERRAPDEISRAPWSAIPGSGVEVVRGEVIWSDLDQEGYMRIEGLTPNDPSVEQYQLWIVDSDRGTPQPVDGGVFDVAATEGIQTIPIDAALRVAGPDLFLITLEPPGGVVVSERKRDIVLASIQG